MFALDMISNKSDTKIEKMPDLSSNICSDKLLERKKQLEIRLR
ncbi:MAG: hypothetical protein ACFFDH_25060 [Promethearchaeota archaeon]